VVAFGWVGASATGVVVVESKAMCPTIVHVESVVGYDGLQGGWGFLDMGVGGSVHLFVASVLVNAACALRNPACLMVSFHKHSFFSLVKCLQNLMSVC